MRHNSLIDAMGKGLFLALVATSYCVFLSGCSYFGKNSDNKPLIRVGDRVTTVGEFKRTFEVTKAAYPHNVIQEDEVYKEAQLRLLHQLTEEMIILERADELGIDVSDDELEKAVAKIKEDYPEGVFEETLLENAISYEYWKNGLKTRLIIERTIAREVEEQIEITPADLSNYYKEKRSKEKSKNGVEGIEKEKEEVVVRELRRKKAEEKYQKWINELQKKYTIEINDKAWEEIKKS